MGHLIIFALILSGLFTTTVSHAQQVSQGTYKGWQYFKPDTTAYLNWGLESIYNRQNSDLPLKTFFDIFELPITVVEFKMAGQFIVGFTIFVSPYDQIMSLPAKQRSQHGLTVALTLNAIIATPFEEQLPILKSRDKTKFDCIFVKWNPAYNKIIENVKYSYIVY